MSLSPPISSTAAVIAIDGPAGAGKSTVARMLAQRLGFFLLDTGAIYRAVTFDAARRGIALADSTQVGEIARTLAIRFTPEGRTLLGSEDVSTAIRTPEVSAGASTVSAHPQVRAALLDLQRNLAAQGRCVVEGRDIGTVVLPWAPLKIFLTASPEERARRRYDELVARGATVSFDETLRDQIERDRRDASRELAPLRQADDAVLVDTTGLELEAVVARLEALAKSRLHFA